MRAYHIPNIAKHNLQLILRVNLILPAIVMGLKSLTVSRATTEEHVIFCDTLLLSPMMPDNVPSALFRCWLARSKGGLKSRILYNRVRWHHFIQAGLLQELQRHEKLCTRIPAAFMSTTSRFLRALHIAYNEMWLGEDRRNITIAFFTIVLDTQTRTYHTEDSAIGDRSSEEEAEKFEKGYTFL